MQFSPQPQRDFMSPVISVILPAYNAAATLEEAVESLRAGTYEDFEIVLIDDGSEDQTWEVIRHLASMDPRIRPIKTHHSGLIHALNLGLSEARGEFIARMDANDLSHPQRLALQFLLLNRRPEVVLAGCMVESFPSSEIREGFRIYTDWINSLIEPDEIAREIFIESPICHPSVLIRKGELTRIGGYRDPGWAEDYDLWLRLNLAGKHFAKVPKVLFSWRDHPDRLTRTDSRYSVENFLRAKAHYLAAGPLRETMSTIVWGAGQTGRRLSKHLIHEGVRLLGFIDIDPSKIGRTLRNAAIQSPEALPDLRRKHKGGMILSAVSSRGARNLIRGHLKGLDLVEGVDFLCVA